jgi:hypothetical protein
MDIRSNYVRNIWLCRIDLALDKGAGRAVEDRDGAQQVVVVYGLSTLVALGTMGILSGGIWGSTLD